MQVTLDNVQQLRMQNKRRQGERFWFHSVTSWTDWFKFFFFRSSHWWHIQWYNNEPELENDDNEDGNSSGSDDEDIQPKRPKRILTYQRKVHSIDTALDETNYTAMTLPEELKTIQGIAKGYKNCSDTVYEFSNQKPIDNRGRQRQADILVGKPGPTATGKNTLTAIDAFYKFFTNEMIAHILERTNAIIGKILESTPEKLLSRDNFMKETTAIEIRSFIGLLIYKGLYKLNTFRISRLFSERYGPPMFSGTISRNRFFIIFANL